LPYAAPLRPEEPEVNSFFALSNGCLNTKRSFSFKRYARQRFGFDLAVSSRAASRLPVRFSGFLDNGYFAPLTCPAFGGSFFSVPF
jgi:hypothetical protein